MTNSNHQFLTYLGECLRLLYWIYFKPYTFKYWLQDIHPDLTPTDNPFNKKAEFATNPRLRRYAGQVRWLTAIVPILAVLVVAPIYILASGENFNWVLSLTFLLGWLIGLILIRGNNRTIFFSFAAALFVMFLAFRFLSDVAFGVAVGVAFGVAVGVAVGVAFGVAVGVAGGVAFGVAVGVAGGVAGGVAVGVAGGVAVGVAGGVAVGVAFGVAVGVAFGVAVGVAFGVAVGVAWVLGVLRVYFWLPEIWWMLIRFLSSRLDSQRIDYYLRSTPPFFDELIILPLPFMNNMIVKAYQSHPQVALETIDYLISYTNQQKVAARAIIEININTLIRCQKVSDIVAITYQPIRQISQTTTKSDNVLLSFLDISQAVKAADEATSAYRKSELLNIPITELQTVKQSLAFNKNSGFTTQFSKTADRWLNILETAQRTLTEKAQQSQEIPQVYIAGSSLSPDTAKNRFKGRIDIFREIENFTLSEQSSVLLLFGGRRTGKTSALKYLPHRIGPKIIPLLVDVQGTAAATTLPGLAKNLSNQIIEAARILPRPILLHSPDSENLAKDPFPTLQTWLTEIERKNPGKQFILCLDEFERLSEVIETTNSRAPLNFIRNLLQHQRQWNLLFSGSHELSELPDYWSDYLINTRALRMTYLRDSEARELILQPVEEFPQIYEPDAVDRIIELTHCQPYLVQLLCYELVELINRDIRKQRRELKTATVNLKDVELIIPTVLETGDQYFRELWRDLRDNERDFLRRLVAGEIPTQKDRGVIKKLTRKQILNANSDNFQIPCFQVPLVEQFIQQLLEEES